MKTTIIHGVNHKGSTWSVTKMLANNLNSDETKEFYIPRDMPSPCSGCGSCFFKGEEFCPHYESMSVIVKALDEADVIIIDSPVYVFGVSGQLKQFLDHLGYRWFVHRPEGSMCQKIGVAISTAAGAGTGKANAAIKNNLRAWGIPKTFSYGSAVLSLGWDSVSAETKKKLCRDMRALAKKINSAAGHVKPNPITFAVFHAMRLSHIKNPDPPIKKDRDYWLAQGWLGDKRPAALEDCASRFPRFGLKK